MSLTRRWSTSTRLTLANAGVIVLCFLILVMTIIGFARYFMREHIRENVDAELHIMTSEFDQDGERGVVRLILSRLQVRDAEHQRIYRYEDRHGQVLAANLSAWPPGRVPPSRYLELPSLGHPEDTRVVARWEPLPDGSRLLIGNDEYELRHMEQRIDQVSLFSLLLVVLLSLLASRQITRNALRPIEGMRRSAEQIMSGDLHHRLAVSGSGDEFDALSGTLNDMLDRIEQLIGGIKGATDNIAHDLRSPLARHRGRLEAALLRPPAPAAWPDWIDSHLRDIDQVLSTFQALLKLASIDGGMLRSHFAELDLGQLCRDAANFMEPLAESRDQRLSLSLPPQPLLMDGHRDLLLQLVINLLDNACKYGPAGSDIRLSLKRGATHWTLCISDAGPGIPASERDKVFERLYRLDQTRQTPGLGLGLSLVKATTQLHGGKISLGDAGPGLRVTITCPYQR